MEEYLALLFCECMVQNNRFFSERDFIKLLQSQRLNDNFNLFNITVSNYLLKNNLSSGYILKDNIWQPINFARSHKKISYIIEDLKLDSELEFSLDNFSNTSCDIIQKINNYIWLSEY
jgi:hypothetical protein